MQRYIVYKSYFPAALCSVFYTVPLFYINSVNSKLLCTNGKKHIIARKQQRKGNMPNYFQESLLDISLWSAIIISKASFPF